MVVDLHNMEFGECIAIHGNGENILMVDCGSRNYEIRQYGYNVNQHVLNRIVPQYMPAPNRRFLLTHFHEDHYSGFIQILENNPGFFSKVILPPVILVENRPILLELALYLYVFAPAGSRLFASSEFLVEVFTLLERTIGLRNVGTVQQGDHFTYDGIEYDVLWPEINFEIPLRSIELLEYIKNLEEEHWEAADDTYRRFLEYKERFIHAYTRLSSLLHYRSETIDSKEVSDRPYSEFIETIKKILAFVKELKSDRLFTISDLAIKIKDVLALRKSRNIFKNDLNATSIVFHSENQFILMTGDATPAVFTKIHDLLHPRYKFIKAPHHGTRSCYSLDLHPIMKSGWLISNGEYDHYGAIDIRYSTAEMGSRCTNHTVCEHYRREHTLCNPASVCNQLLVQTEIAP